MKKLLLIVMCLVLVATFCCCEQLPPDDDTSHKTTDNVFLSELGNPSFYEDFSTEEKIEGTVLGECLMNDASAFPTKIPAIVQSYMK